MVASDNARVTVITGGGSGMGRATALRLAGQGDQVCICDFKEENV
ncbi:MAG: SDR family NAD(P)-dependent oxidoreductase, partial [Deltaproteobacteria bacterium]|nr:SDR family NAD(P)-dependent oxidoreductase [Deltaproteobacteria bacterium]